MRDRHAASAISVLDGVRAATTVRAAVLGTPVAERTGAGQGMKSPLAWVVLVIASTARITAAAV